MTLVFSLIASLLLSCSIDYGRGKSVGERRPNIVFTNINVDRYENAEPSLLVFCERLEMYSKDKMWAGKSFEFRQLEKHTQNNEFLGKAGLALIDNQKEEYLLGDDVEFISIKDKLSISAPSLYWIKKESILSSPKDDVVSIVKEGEMSIRGSGFVAHTSSKEFELKNQVEGVIDTEKKEEERKDEIQE